ncbi:MAG: hypothetical protein ACPGVG_08955 [Mycobacterium sp.]
MSWANIFTTHEFWTGGLVIGVLSGVITFVSTRASDRRKFKQEDKVLDRKEDRDDKLREQESLYSAASEYTEVCSDILMNSIDTKGAFNAIRDMFFNTAGKADPKVEDKLDHATKMVEQTSRITVPINRLRLVAPNNVLEAATQLNAAMLAVLRTTTEPFAAPVTLKTAGDQLENFVNVFRKELGRDEYTKSMAQQQTLTFLANLQSQVDAYLVEAKADMRAAGFRSTPWDNMPDA